MRFELFRGHRRGLSGPRPVPHSGDADRPGWSGSSNQRHGKLRDLLTRRSLPRPRLACDKDYEVKHAAN